MTEAAEQTSPPVRIERADPTSSILIASGRTDLGLRAGTVIELDGHTHAFKDDTEIRIYGTLSQGRDYGLSIDEAGKPFAALVDGKPLANGFIGGFHFAPGGNADGCSGGDAVPAINPHSFWDVDFRPACADPCGMAMFEMAGGRRVWGDIYMLGTDHKEQGTSRFAVEIADGNSLGLLDYPTAVEIYNAHGKRLMTYDEFRTAAFGVTERSSADRHPRRTGLDAARTSRIGLMQPTGNLWAWGTDGDSDDPRPSIFGGSWFSGSIAGSRYAILDFWPVHSHEDLSARGACDHLQPDARAEARA